MRLKPRDDARRLSGVAIMCRRSGIAATARSPRKIERARRGFTLIEMVTVLAIIAVLALMAVPSIQGRLVREQIVTALAIADVAKAPIGLMWASLQAFPANNEDAGLPVAEKIVSNLVSAVHVRDGAIDVTFGNSANGIIKGKTLTLRPAVVDDAPVVPIAWICAGAPVPSQMTAKGEDKTDIPAEYLPVNCRG